MFYFVNGGSLARRYDMSCSTVPYNMLSWYNLLASSNTATYYWNKCKSFCKCKIVDKRQYESEDDTSSKSVSSSIQFSQAIVSWYARFATAEHQGTSLTLCSSSASEATAVLMRGTRYRPSCVTHRRVDSSKPISKLAFIIKLYPDC